MQKKTLYRSWWRSWPCNCVAGMAAVFMAVLALPVYAASLVDVSFSEGGGLNATNAGSLGGTGAIVVQNAFPAFSPNAPSGTYGPQNNSGAIDFGGIGATDGGRAIDLPGGLGAMNGFTICGWVNCRDLAIGWGGNRIVFALQSGNGPGFDLVQLANGSLQLGVNQWPDSSPAVSSAGRITADPDAAAVNWVFLAVTYDGTLASGQVNYYFGNASALAALDVTRDYNQGVITTSGTLTIGNFSTIDTGARGGLGSLNSRCFRGLMDEIKVFPAVLTLEEIQTVQTSAAAPPPALAFAAEPVDARVLAGRDATFSVSVTGGYPIYYQWQRNNEDIAGANSATYTVTAASVGDSGAQLRVVVTNPVSALTSSNATLYVNSDGTPPAVVALTPINLTNLLISFSEPVDTGSAQEPGNYILADGNLNTYSAVLQANLTNVLVTTDPMVAGQQYVLTVQYLADRAVPTPNMMDVTNITFTAYNPPPLPVEIFEAHFSEGGGNNVFNSGSAGGTGVFDYGLASSVAGLPKFTNNVPVGPYAPSGNGYSLYWGTGSSSANYAGKALDFPNAVRTNTVGLTKFTLAGWLNKTDANAPGGGSRIFSTWPNNLGGNASLRSGIDLVVADATRLRLGVNQAPDYPTPPTGPYSGTKLTTSADGNPTNWLFFAVTYDATISANNVSYYFGNASNAAAFDVSATYLQGPVTDALAACTLTLGNFNDSSILTSARDDTGSSRVFRGLMDEIRLYGTVLTLDQIRQVQTKVVPVLTSPPGIQTQPINVVTFEGQAAAFSAVVTGTPPTTLQWQRDNANITGANSSSYSLTAVTLADNGAVFRLVASNAQGVATSSGATLTVLAEDGLKAHFAFGEGSGTLTTNLGNLRGNGAFAQQNAFPTFSSNVPLGPFAPANNTAAVDFGSIVNSTDGGRSVDLNGAIMPSLGAMNGFTVCGWLNARDLAVGWGGNRITFAMDAPNGHGFDLVHQADGALRLGINQWPDDGVGGPISSPNKLTADPNAGAGNWVFFAVTYDSALSSGQVKYFFGSAARLVALDVARDYNRGAMAMSGTVTLGNFGAVASARNEVGPNGGSRCFRGLMDDVKVYNRTLTLEQIQLQQLNGALPPSTPGFVTQPASVTLFEGMPAAFSGFVTGTAPVTLQWQRNGTEIPGANSSTYSLPAVALADHGAVFRLVASNVLGVATSSEAILTVLPEDGLKVSLAFEEGVGTLSTNLGNLRGNGVFAQQNAFPAFSSNVPLGPYAPTGSVGSLDFGMIVAAEDGGRSVDLNGAIMPSLGPMSALTISGWLNARDLAVGWGGNRVAFALDAPNGHGFDLVHQVDGALRLGINQWPDVGAGGPISSANKLTADSNAGAGNWVFFAVTYDSTLPNSQVNYYFGNATTPVALDVARDYNRGLIEASGSLSIGNFSNVDSGARNGTGPGGGSRCFRGLMDDVKVQNRALALGELRALQRNVPYTMERPSLSMHVVEGQMEFSWDSPESFQLEYTEVLGLNDWHNVTETPTVVGTVSTVRVPFAATNRFYRLRH